MRVRTIYDPIVRYRVRGAGYTGARIRVLARFGALTSGSDETAPLHEALVDTGAWITLFPKHVWQDLQLLPLGLDATDTDQVIRISAHHKYDMGGFSTTYVYKPCPRGTDEFTRFTSMVRVGEGVIPCSFSLVRAWFYNAPERSGFGPMMLPAMLMEINFTEYVVLGYAGLLDRCHISLNGPRGDGRLLFIRERV